MPETQTPNTEKQSAAQNLKTHYDAHSSILEKRQWAWRLLDQILSQPQTFHTSPELAKNFSESYLQFLEEEKAGLKIVDAKRWSSSPSTPQTIAEFKAPLRTLYSPSAGRHILSHFYALTECLKVSSVSAVDRAYCLGAEFPTDAHIIKLAWSRMENPLGFRVPNTSNAALLRLSSQDFEWREFTPTQRRPPLVITVGPGESYALVGLHVMSKAAPDWIWISAWWSPDDASNFGADRPQDLWDSWLKEAKLCLVDNVQAPSPPQSNSSLAEALKITGDFNSGHSWCSNPYVEHGKGNARSNCMGCHQYAGPKINPGNILKESLQNPLRLVGKDNRKIALDYSWSLIQGEKALGLELLDWRDYYETKWSGDRGPLPRR